MFCKFCGGKIDRQTMVCADCGKAVGPLEGGVGFWDLAGKGETRKPVANNSNTERKTDVILEKLEYLETKKSPLPAITVILLGICLLVNLAFIGIVLNLNKTVEYLRTDIQIMKAEDNREEVLPGTEPVILETEPEETEAALIEAEIFPIQITKQPTGEVLREPDSVTADTPQWLFYVIHVKAIGNGIDFRWQKYDDINAVWNDIDDLHYIVENNELPEGETESKLWLQSADDSVYGEYRCCVTDENDNCWVSDVVTLNPSDAGESSDEGATESSASPTEDVG